MNPEQLRELLRAIVDSHHAAGSLAVGAPEQIVLERPKNRDHGDWASNIALQLAKPAGRPPREVAELIAEQLRSSAGIGAVEVAGPGFLNISLDAAAAGALAAQIVESGESYGRSAAMSGHRINLEFVSANPTGPLHLGHTRWAALGDAIARVLRAAGAEVDSEYYINDAGSQMDVFAGSVLASLRGEPTPEKGYPGAYIDELAEQVRAQRPEIAELPVEEALPIVRELAYAGQLADIRTTLDDFGVHFDIWTSEAELHDSDAVSSAIVRLREQGHVFDESGAVWLRTTEFGDDKDRVLIRADGQPTYFAADAAYYLDKRDRGYPEKIYLLGADHHGYVGRLKAIAAAAGDDPEQSIEILIGQLISVNGARLSKRAGNIIELRDLIDWLGADAVRYQLARTPADSPLTLEPEVLRSRSNDNPVYYVQYAHARTAGVSRNAAEAGIRLEDAVDPALLGDPTEARLLAALADFPRIVEQAAELREPHRVARYLESTASLFHKWYDACRVTPQGEAPLEPVHRARLELNRATGTVLRNGLALMGVSAPERM